MASSIPYTESIYTSPVSYSPDFSFLSSNMQKKEQQYQQGVAQVASGYSNLLNQPITSDENKLARAEYIKTAQEGLKKLSAEDMSLPKNVVQAESLYAPFWQDQYLMQDIAYTKKAQSAIQTGYSTRDSKDSDVRKSFDPRSIEYIQNGLERLKGAKRDQSAYNRLENREWIPVQDIDADIAAAYKMEGQKGVTNTNNYGPTSVTTTNGIQSKDAFKTYYLSKVGSKYDGQIRMIATVENERQKKDILRQNPELDPKQLNEHFAAENLDKLGTTYAATRDSYLKLGDNYQRQKDALELQISKQQGQVAREDQYAKMQELNDQIALHKKAADTYDIAFRKIGYGDVNSPEYQKEYMDMAEHPDEHLMAIHKDFMADRWASGMASIGSVTSDVNKGWAEYEKVLLEQQKNDITMRGQTLTAETARGHDLNGRILPGYNAITGWGGDGTSSSSSSTGGSNKSTGIEGGSITGMATAYPGRTAQGLDIVQDNFNRLSAIVHGSVFDHNGVAGALTTAGIGTEDIINFNGWANNPQGATDAQKAALLKVQAVMKDKGIPYDNSVTGMQNALLTFGPTAVQGLMNSGIDTDVQKASKIVLANNNATYTRDKLIRNQKEYNTAVNREVLTNKSFNKLTYTNSDGTKRLLTVDDMAPDFPHIKLKGDDGPSAIGQLFGSDRRATMKDLSSREFAELYKSGRISIPGGNSVFIDGKPFFPVDDNGYPSNAIPDLNKLVYAKNGLADKYGKPEDIVKLNKMAAAAVIPSLKEYKDGIIVPELTYDPSNPQQLATASEIGKALANPANGPLMYNQQPDNSLGSAVTDSKVIQNARSLMSNMADGKGYVTGYSKVVTPEGKPAWRVSFNGIPDSDARKDMNGQVYIIPESANISAPILTSIPGNTGIYIYGELLQGKTISADATTRAAGYDYKLIPSPVGPDGKATSVTIIIDRTVPDPAHAGATKKAHVEEDIPLTGAYGKTPDELMRIVNSRILAHMGEVVNNTKTVNDQVAPGGRTLSQIQQSEQQRLQPTR